jgi:hypothetical protein
VDGGGEQCGGGMVGSKGGRGGVKQTHPLLTTGGKQAILGVKVLEKCLDDLQNLDRTRARSLAKCARTWQLASQM